MMDRYEKRFSKVDDMSTKRFKLFFFSHQGGKTLFTECNDDFWLNELYLRIKVAFAALPLDRELFCMSKRLAFDGMCVVYFIQREFKNVLDHIFEHFSASSCKIGVCRIFKFRDGIVDKHHFCMFKAGSRHTLCSTLTEVA